MTAINIIRLSAPRLLVVTKAGCVVCQQCGVTMMSLGLAKSHDVIALFPGPPLARADEKYGVFFFTAHTGGAWEWG